MQSAELKKHNALFYAERLISERPHGLKLIEFEKGRLATSTEGSRLLKSLPASHPTNLVFIFGNARSGKSFMMNCLVGVKGLFQVINSATPCTRGVDISSYTVKQEVLAASVRSHHMTADADENPGLEEPAITGKSPLVGFVDVEGQGAEDGTYDTMLALPLLLTSRVVLFNHKGAPTVSDMLSKLGVLARAAEYIDLEDDDVDDGTNAERKSVSRKATLTRTPSTDGTATTHTNKINDGKKKFGHLHVLFRDFSFTGEEGDVRDQLMGREALPKEPKKAKSLKDGPASSHLDVSRSIQERNDIRALLEANFESINVHLFRQPADPDALKAHAELPASLVDEEFISSVHTLLAEITVQLAKPTTFNNTILTGPRLQTLISQVTTALNENGLINVPSVYRAMETETVNRVANELLADFDREVQKMKANLPMSFAKLDGLICALVRLLQSRFDEDLSECRLEPEKIKKKEELKLAGDKALTELTILNTTATYKRARETISKHFTQCKSDFDLYVNENIPMEDVKLLDEKFGIMKKQAEMAIEADLRELPECLKSQEYRVLLLDAQESLTEFLHLKSIQNQNAIKEKQIQKLRDDAIKQQQMLIEQNKRLEQYITDEKKTTQELERELELLKQQKQDAEKDNIEAKARLDAQIKELERLRKAKKCVML